MKIMLDEGAKMPTRAHPWDAGLDLYSPVDCVVPPCKTVFSYTFGEPFPQIETVAGSITIDTGVHVEIPEGYVGFVKSKSGLMVKHCITTDGTIDSHYTGPIKVKLFNHHPYLRYDVSPGDKIAQLVIVPCLLPELELVDHLEETDRGDGGFGSTGR